LLPRDKARGDEGMGYGGGQAESKLARGDAYLLRGEKRKKKNSDRNLGIDRKRGLTIKVGGNGEKGTACVQAQAKKEGGRRIVERKKVDRIAGDWEKKKR